MQIKGVITGDIVASSTLSYEEQDQLLLTLKEVAEEVQTISALKIGKTSLYPMEISSLWQRNSF